LDDCGASVLVHSADADALVAAAEPWPSTLRHVLGTGEFAAGPALDAAPPVSLEDPALILYASGRNGQPRGAVLTHGSMTGNTVGFLAHVDVLSTDRAL